MIRYVIRRLLFIAATLLVLSFLIFTLTEILPGDVATAVLGRWATAESLEVLRARLGLDQPALIRYFKWLIGMARMDWGTSLSMNVPVFPLVMRRFGNSLVLASMAFILVVPVSLSMGVAAGLRKGSWFDGVVSVVGLAGLALPEFVTGVFLIIVFGLWLKVLPASSAISQDASPLRNVESLLLPSMALGFVIFGYISRMMRSSLADVMGKDYIRTAVLKGLPRSSVIFRHAVRNALLPTVTVIASLVGWMVGGLVVVESLFSYPGLGRLLLDAAMRQDLPVLQATTMVVAVTYVGANLAADVAYALLNPRIRYT